ncbi:hypothetical protein AAG570_003651 [Ranatra chinensis]|uniref:Uncharacterized protein n=1 Tax=Ranatra chinensis TaxID=642074 RepID=A0ABD0Y499_9HEMI
MGSKRRNMFYQNKKQETTEIGARNLPLFYDLFLCGRVTVGHEIGIGPIAFDHTSSARRFCGQEMPVEEWPRESERSWDDAIGQEQEDRTWPRWTKPSEDAGPPRGIHLCSLFTIVLVNIEILSLLDGAKNRASIVNIGGRRLQDGNKLVPILNIPVERSKYRVRWVWTHGRFGMWSQRTSGMTLFLDFIYGLIARILNRRCPTELKFVESRVHVGSVGTVPPVKNKRVNRANITSTDGRARSRAPSSATILAILMA